MTPGPAAAAGAPGSLPPPSALHVATVAAGLQGASALPMFFLGGLAVQIRGEMGFGPAALGAATGAFVLARALAVVPLGRLVDRLGSLHALRLAAAGTALSTLCIALLARSWATLAASLALGGAAQAITQPAANRFVARGVSASRLGVAFGLKQSGPPVASLLAGLAVPAIALTVGWRWAYVGAAALCVLALFFTVGWERMPEDHPGRQSSRRTEGVGLWLLALSFAFQLAVVNSLNTFVVESAVEAGIDPGYGGFLLAGGSAVAIGARLLIGIQADRRGRGHLRVVAQALVLSAVGFVLLSLGRPAALIAGATLVYATAWGISGLFFMAVMRNNPSNPGAATGTMVAGGSIGGLCGPPIFGLIVGRYGFPPAWLTVAGWTLLASLAVTLARARLLQRRAAALG